MGKSVEITEDWFAQDIEGKVYYCGELVLNFEEQEDGEAELVDREGSFKVGRDVAKPGLIMPAAPAAGLVYRQEFALGEAEDVPEIVATDGAEAAPGGSCSGDRLVTREHMPIEPGVCSRPNITLPASVFCSRSSVALVSLSIRHRSDEHRRRRREPSLRSSE